MKEISDICYGKAKEYPPMIFFVADNDMENRYEQIKLTISTLRHFGYDESKIYYKLMKGTHCNYSSTEKFAEIICDFIENINLLPA